MILDVKSKFLLEAGQAYGYEGPPFLSSTGSVCPPCCTLFANLQEARISLVQPVSYKRFIKSLITMDSRLLPKNKEIVLAQFATSFIYTSKA